MKKSHLLFLLLFALLVAARMCHVSILWAEETLPLAAARQMLHGKTLYQGIWFDKPPLLAAVYLLWAARIGWLLRLAGALYALLACWIAYRFARDLWSEREGLWAAALLGFFLTFDFASSVIPLASDLLMLAPHLAAVWLAWKRRAFWSGAMAGVAFLVSPKGLMVAAVCALWNPAGVLVMVAGFAAVCGTAVAWLGLSGSLNAYWDQVWHWGRIYAGGTFVAEPWHNGLVRTLDWAGFHAAIVVAAVWFAIRLKKSGSGPPMWAWAGWVALSLTGVVAGWRFFPRYYFELLPVMVLAAARGFTLLGRKREFVALLLLIPASRFGPRYVMLAAGRTGWTDTAMDDDSRAAAALVRRMERPGDTLFVWGFRPELYVYTNLPAATRFLDSQPLTGVPADRHLTQWVPVEHAEARQHRAELAQSRPTFVLDGLGLYNRHLAIDQFPDLREWFASYEEIARTHGTVIYRLREASIPSSGKSLTTQEVQQEYARLQRKLPYLVPH
ncbi:MAG TPA: hypothetical protein VG675_08625 [Bryobacteraceae bacterium]|nr:hypothetical protein [Bryobacteraceae bacterium]